MKDFASWHWIFVIISAEWVRYRHTTLRETESLSKAVGMCGIPELWIVCIELNLEKHVSYMPGWLRSVVFRPSKLPCRREKKKERIKKNITGLPKEKVETQIMWSLRRRKSSVSGFSIPNSSPFSWVSCIYVLWNSSVCACQEIPVANNFAWATNHSLTTPFLIPVFKCKSDHVKKLKGINISK